MTAHQKWNYKQWERGDGAVSRTSTRSNPAAGARRPHVSIPCHHGMEVLQRLVDDPLTEVFLAVRLGVFEVGVNERTDGWKDKDGFPDVVGRSFQLGSVVEKGEPGSIGCPLHQLLYVVEARLLHLYWRPTSLSVEIQLTSSEYQTADVGPPRWPDFC